MPLYEYRCDACGHRFEKIQKFSDPLETACPKCGGVVRKLMSSPAIQFKGSGFYITDYAKKDSASAKFDRGQSEPRKSEAEKSEAGKSEAGKDDGKSASSEKSTAAETKAKTDTSSAKTATPAAASKDTKTS